MRRAALILVALAMAGCGGGSASDSADRPEPDCAYPLVWAGTTYDPELDLPATSELGPSLGAGTVLGCGDLSEGGIPDERVGVRRIEGIHPEVAVAALLEGGTDPIVWLAPGYLLESPAHPLHRAAVESAGVGEPPGDDFTCGRPLATPGRALSTPRQNFPLEVQAEEPAVESLLTEAGTQRVVSLTTDTVITGLERHGVPYIERGDEFTLVVRACDGVESESGVAGLRLLYADRLAGGG
jgi:hypothetical protein